MPNSGLQKNDPFQEALHHYHAGRYEKARRLLTDLSRNQPFACEVWLNLGNAYFQLNDNEEARVCWKKALDIDPMEEKIYLNLGNLFFKEKRYQAALFYWEIFRSLRKDHTDVLINMGLAYEKMGDMRNAMAHYNHYVKLTPGNRESVKINMRFEHAWKNYKQSMEQAEKYVKRKDFRRARDIYARAFTMYPAQLDDLKRYAVLLYKREFYNEAQTQYLLAYEIAPEDPVVLINLGVVYEKLHRPIEALWAYNIARTLSSPEQERVKQRFEELLLQNESALERYFEDTQLLHKRQKYDQAAERLPILKGLFPFVAGGQEILEQVDHEHRLLRDPRTRALTQYTTHGDALWREGKVDQALKFYQKILPLNPSDELKNRTEKRIKEIQTSIGQVINTVMTMKNDVLSDGLSTDKQPS